MGQPLVVRSYFHEKNPKFYVQIFALLKPIFYYVFCLVMLLIDCLTHLREKPVRQHLKNVYATLAISMLAAAAGAYFHLTIFPAVSNHG